MKKEDRIKFIIVETNQPKFVLLQWKDYSILMEREAAEFILLSTNSFYPMKEALEAILQPSISPELYDDAINKVKTTLKLVRMLVIKGI